MNEWIQFCSLDKNMEDFALCKSQCIMFRTIPQYLFLYIIYLISD